MNTKTTQNVNGFGSLVMALVSTLLSILLWGVSLKFNWAWFVVPTFPTLPVLSLSAAAGIAFAVRSLLFHGNYHPKEVRDSRDFRVFLNVSVVVVPAMQLLLGFLLHLVV